MYQFGFVNVAAVSTHSRPKAAGSDGAGGVAEFEVSTHSRPKAAGAVSFIIAFRLTCFNTQPPEGGWLPA